MRLLHTSFAFLLVGLSGCFSAVGTDLPEPAVHRSERMACDDVRDSPEVSMSAFGACTSHAECTEGANGRCLQGRGETYCSYDQCFADSECGGPCDCGEGVEANFCRGGGCQVDSDCGPEGWCSPTYGSCGSFGGVVAYECHTPNDQCTDDSDCADVPNGYCAFSPEGERWVCGSVQCVG